MMKEINVVAAVRKQGARILATQRGYGPFKDWWEFPGGKVEAGEEKEAALIREIREELNAEISINKFLITVEYDYPEFHLILHCYLCSFTSPHFELLEHENARWLSAAELDSLRWLPADIEVVNLLRKEHL